MKSRQIAIGLALIMLTVGLLAGLRESGWSDLVGLQRPQMSSEGDDGARGFSKESLAQLATIKDRSVVTLLVGEQQLQVEVVNSPLSITQGLSGRAVIGHDGMLFVMVPRQVTSFWMKEMQFDLDLIWIDNSTIVGITSDVPAPEANTSLVDLPKFSSVVPVTHVLEVPAGTAKIHNWQVGSTVQLVN